MRRLFIALLLTGFVLISTGIFHVYAGEPQYKSPWFETDMNLNKLVKEGYKIVGTAISASPLSFAMGEIIYLQKKDKLYRCLTVEKEEESLHECNLLKEPKKIK